MPQQRLFQILDEVTTRYRKGPEEEIRQVGPVEVIDIYAMPHVDEAPEALAKIDVGVPMTVGVDKAAAEPLKDEVRRLILEIAPNGAEDWRRGPSYIAVGGWLGSQDAAFALFALGEVLGFWHVVTPQKMGAKDETLIREMAGAGYVMVSGLRDA